MRGGGHRIVKPHGCRGEMSPGYRRIDFDRQSKSDAALKGEFSSELALYPAPEHTSKSCFRTLPPKTAWSMYRTVDRQFQKPVVISDSGRTARGSCLPRYEFRLLAVLTAQTPRARPASGVR